MDEFMAYMEQRYDYDSWKIPTESGEGIRLEDMNPMPDFDGFVLEESISCGIPGSYRNTYRGLQNPRESICLSVIPCVDAADARQALMRRLSVMAAPDIERIVLDGKEVAFGNRSEEGEFQIYCDRNVVVEIVTYGQNNGIAEKMPVLQEIF